MKESFLQNCTALLSIAHGVVTSGLCITLLVLIILRASDPSNVWIREDQATDDKYGAARLALQSIAYQSAAILGVKV